MRSSGGPASSACAGGCWSGTEGVGAEPADWLRCRGLGARHRLRSDAAAATATAAGGSAARAQAGGHRPRRSSGRGLRRARWRPRAAAAPPAAGAGCADAAGLWALGAGQRPPTHPGPVRRDRDAADPLPRPPAREAQLGAPGGRSGPQGRQRLNRPAADRTLLLGHAHGRQLPVHHRRAAERSATPLARHRPQGAERATSLAGPGARPPTPRPRGRATEHLSARRPRPPPSACKTPR